VSETIRIAPSILAADFGSLSEAIQTVENGGADLIHVDVMDGHFVPQISIGVPVVAALHKVATVPLDVHLMITEPERQIESYVKAGAAMISVHFEATRHIHRTLSLIRALGATAGLAVNPGTPVSALEAIADQVDYVVVMSVNPGYAGQTFIPSSTERVRAVRRLLDGLGNRAPIEVDGGVTHSNASSLVNVGAEILVAASAIYGDTDPADATRRLRAAAQHSDNSKKVDSN
jgi:ribulose-phosphate 3-epimerase